MQQICSKRVFNCVLVYNINDIWIFDVLDFSIQWLIVAGGGSKPCSPVQAQLINRDQQTDSDWIEQLEKTSQSITESGDQTEQDIPKQSDDVSPSIDISLLNVSLLYFLLVLFWLTKTYRWNLRIVEFWAITNTDTIKALRWNKTMEWLAIKIFFGIIVVFHVVIYIMLISLALQLFTTVLYSFSCIWNVFNCSWMNFEAITIIMWV